MEHHWLLSSSRWKQSMILHFKVPESWWEKKWRGRVNFGKLKFGSSPFASKMSVQTSYIKRIKLFLFLPELSRSLLDNLDLHRVYRSHSVRSVLKTSVKILPYRPPARFIRANYFTHQVLQNCFSGVKFRANCEVFLQRQFLSVVAVKATCNQTRLPGLWGCVENHFIRAIEPCFPRLI